MLAAVTDQMSDKLTVVNQESTLSLACKNIGIDVKQTTGESHTK